MGAADVVPGVSGGTIALITGIYKELIGSFSKINLGLFKILRKEGIVAAFKSVNGPFLVALVSGIAISIFSLAKLFHYLIEHQPVLVWSFFFGLIIASVWLVGKRVESWNQGYRWLTDLRNFDLLWDHHYFSCKRSGYPSLFISIRDAGFYCHDLTRYFGQFYLVIIRCLSIGSG